MTTSGIGERLCPLCGGLRRDLLLELNRFEVVRCSDCSMVFLAQDISYQEQTTVHEFSESYRAEHEVRRRKHPLLVGISGWTRRLKPEIGDRLLAQTLRWRKSGKLADFGCGDGKFLEKAAQHFDVTGVEISPAQAQRAAARVPQARILCGSVTQTALSAGEFDVVTQFSILEHEWRPRAALRVAFDALRPGRVTVIKVPNHASWNRHIMRQDWCGYRIPDHCNYFTPRTLAEMLRRSGFQILPGSFLDRLPTSDSLWMAAEKPVLSPEC